jgi:protein-S-isoprenylcysteine O-methyltransferase Ste14
MHYWNDPFFWALISMFGLVGCCAVVGTRRIGGITAAGLCLVAVFDFGRLMLPLPLFEQPRFVLGGFHGMAGGILFTVGLIFGLGPCLNIRALNAAEKGMHLETGGFYRICRNPIYLGEIMLWLGWAVMFRSWIGIALTPLWWGGLLFLIAIEEEMLEREIGEPYMEYKTRIRGRIIPGLPF